MNWVDLTIIFVLVLFAVEAIGRSLVLELLDFASFATAFFVSFAYYNLLAHFFESQFHLAHGLALILGFFGAWFISEALFYLLVRILIPKLPNIKFPYSTLLSSVPAIFRGLVFVSLALVMIATFPIQPGVKKQVLDSKLGSQILKISYSMEGPVKGVFGGVTNDTLTFLTIKPETHEKINLGFQTDKISQDEQSQKKMIELVNNERINLGIKPLISDEKLTEIAQIYSEDMLKRGYFSHYSPEGKTVADRAINAGVDFLVIGENLAYAPNVDAAFKGLMSSEGHKANILSTDYHKLGIGVADGGIYGEMFTQVFSN